VRANSYRAARLLNLGLTAWASHWAEGHELRQKAVFFKEARRRRRMAGMLSGWVAEAERRRVKRQHAEM